jgi:hypothetical protein
VSSGAVGDGAAFFQFAQSEVSKQKVLGKLFDKFGVLGELSFSLSTRLVRVTEHIPCTSCKRLHGYCALRPFFLSLLTRSARRVLQRGSGPAFSSQVRSLPICH